MLFCQFPHLLSVAVLVVADGVFSLYGLEHVDELFISTNPHPSYPLLISLIVYVDVLLINIYLFCFVFNPHSVVSVRISYYQACTKADSTSADIPDSTCLSNSVYLSLLPKRREVASAGS